MRTRLMRTRVLAIVALGALMATTADAQTRTRTKRTRSTTRIPVSKEPVVTDSVVARDSTPAPAPAPEPVPVVTRRESTTVYTRVETPVPVRRWRYGNGWYIGVGGGASIPTESINNAYNTGFAVQVPIGYDALYSPLGFRVNLGYTRLDARNSFRNTGTTTAFLPISDAQIYSAIADVKLRIPITRGWVGPSSGLYAVGGGGVNHFRHFNQTFALSNPEFNDPGTTADESLTRFALNAGGGVSWAIGAAEVFLESRFVTTFMPHERASYVPIILGLNFY
jgi:hypothetical protein